MPSPPRVMAEKSGGFVREESIDMCIEDLTALKIILTSLGIGQQ